MSQAVTRNSLMTSKVKTSQVKNMQQKASYYFDLFTINHKVIKIFLKQTHAIWRNFFSQ